MGSMTVEEIYKDRKKFSRQVFEVASSDLVNMGITVVSYTLKDIRDDEGYLKVRFSITLFIVESKTVFQGSRYGSNCRSEKRCSDWRG